MDLLGFLQPRQTKRGLSRMLGISWETCDRALARLVDDGLITMEPITGKRGIEGYNIKRQTKEEKDETVSVEEVADRVENVDPMILRQLAGTKRFLHEKCEGQPNIEAMQKIINDGLLRLWVQMGKVSYYYLCLSPWVNKGTMGTEYDFDPGCYTPKITEVVQESFRQAFGYEYSQQRGGEISTGGGEIPIYLW